MKYKSIYVAASGQHVGKTTSTLGLVSAFHRMGVNVGYCKPVGQKMMEVGNIKVDKDALLFSDLLGFTIKPELHSPVILGAGSTSQYLDNPTMFDMNTMVLDAQKSLNVEHELVVYEGTGHPGVGSIANLSNADVAKMLDTDVIIVVEGGIGSTIDMLNLCMAVFRERNVDVKGVIINKVRQDKLEKVRRYVGMYLEQHNLPLLGLLPYDRTLAFPVMHTVAGAIKGTVTHNTAKLNNQIADILAGSLIDLKELRQNKDLLLVVAARMVGRAIEKIRIYSEVHDLEVCPLSGIVATGEGDIDPDSLKYIEENEIPVIRTQLDTYGSVLKISRIEVKINRSTPWKVRKAIELIEDHVNLEQLLRPA